MYAEAKNIWLLVYRKITDMLKLECAILPCRKLPNIGTLKSAALVVIQWSLGNLTSTPKVTVLLEYFAILCLSSGMNLILADLFIHKPAGIIDIPSGICC